MKTKIKLGIVTVMVLAFTLINIVAYSQQLSTGATGISADWRRGGNNGVGAGGLNNILATTWNSPIYFGTNGNAPAAGLKAKLNGQFFVAGPATQYTINGYTFGNGVNTTGYLLLSTNNNSNIYNTKGAFSHLHLNGNGTFVQEFGYRPWMKTGVTFTSNNDLMYMGHKQNGTGTDITDAIIAWSDNGSGGAGPDVMKFVFTAGSNSANINPRDPGSFNGYELMRMQFNTAVTNSAGQNPGYVGIGPVFTNPTPPQSRLHINAEDALTTHLQITSETGTGQTAADGTRLGILNNGTAFLYNQENRHLIFSTNFTTPASALFPTNERMRITHIGAPGVTVTAPANTTRVSISQTPANPIIDPLSVLHIGEAPGGFGLFGYRTWMDIGTLYSASSIVSEHMYTGLKPDPTNNRMDAVINWGPRGSIIPAPAGPHVLSFIFTGATFLGGPAGSFNGLEVGRMVGNHTGAIPFGRVGFGGDVGNGNPYSTGSPDPQNTVEINSPATSVIPGTSGLRFTDLNSTSTTIPNPGLGVLAVDAAGDVIYVPDLPGGGAGIGLCTAPPATTNILGDSRVGLNNFDLFFDGNGAGTAVNNVIIGNPCTYAPVAKLDVLQASGSTNGSIGIYVENQDRQVTFGGAPTIGIKSFVSSTIGQGLNCPKIAGWFQSTYAPNCLGALQQYAIFVPGTIADSHTGGTVDIGFPLAPTTSADWLLDVNNFARINGTIVPSDSQLKTNVSSFNSGLDVIRQIEPKTYNYNGKGGFETQNQYIGVVADNVAQIAPYAVRASSQKLDSSDANPTSILNIYNEAIMYTAVNAIKQLDSSVTTLQNNSLWSVDNNVIVNNYDTRDMQVFGTFMPLGFPNIAGNGTSLDIVGDKNNLNQSRINFDSENGILNFYAGTPVGNPPTMRLDNGQLIVPSLPDNSNNNDSLTKVLVVDESGKIQWRNASTFLGARTTNNGNAQVEIEKIKLTLPDAPVLGDASPNPNSGYAEIPYYLPESSLSLGGATEGGAAKIVFIDMLGRTMQEKTIQTGYGIIGIDTQDLPSGNYYYSLIINGNKIDSKTMVKTK